MSFLLYLIAAATGGFIGGMGMGGGTILIPILSIFFSVEQHSAQAINLIAFIPMAIAALIVHTKKGYVNYKKALWLIFPALIFALLASLLARSISAPILKKLFGIFLIVLAVVQLKSLLKK